MPARSRIGYPPSRAGEDSTAAPVRRRTYRLIRRGMPVNKRIVASFISRRQEFQLAQAVDAEKAAQRCGLSMTVLFAQENAIVQIHQVFEHIAAEADTRPAAFVIEPVKDEGTERLCRNALAAGIGWICLNRSAPYLAAMRQQNPNLPVCAVMTDQVEAGRIQGRQIRALLPRGGKVLFLSGPSMSVTDERCRGTEEVVAGGGIALHKISGTWTEDSGERATRAWLRLKEGSTERIDLIACQNDLMASGARSALLAARPDWAGVPILGMDGLESGGLKLVAHKELTATVIMPSGGGHAVDIVSRWLDTGVQPPLCALQQPRSHPNEAELRPGTGRTKG